MPLVRCLHRLLASPRDASRALTSSRHRNVFPSQPGYPLRERSSRVFSSSSSSNSVGVGHKLVLVVAVALIDRSDHLNPKCLLAQVRTVCMFVEGSLYACMCLCVCVCVCVCVCAIKREKGRESERESEREFSARVNRGTCMYACVQCVDACKIYVCVCVCVCMCVCVCVCVCFYVVSWLKR